MDYKPDHASMTTFEPEGVYAGIPYRVLPDASIEAMMPGGLVKFKDIDQLMAAVNGGTVGNQLVGLLEQNSSQSAALYHQSNSYVRQNGYYEYSSMSLPDLAKHIHEIALAVVRIDAHSQNGRTYELHRSQAETVNADDYSPRIPLNARSELSHREPDEFTEAAADEFSEAPASTSSGQLEILPPKSVPSLFPEHQLRRPDELKHTPHPEEVVLYARAPNLLVAFLIVAMMFVGSMVIATILWPSSNASVAEVASLKSQVHAAQNIAALANTHVAVDPPKLPYPLPTSYGVYALSDKKLVELKTLPINVPDPRVAMSAELKAPSQTIIADDKPAFILFRRELLNNAPETVTVRVVARMVRETKFIDGKAVVAKVEGAWRIRNISYQLKVAPVPGQREMVIARPDETFALPAGRYVLVLNRTGFDFTVKGAITTSAQCLEWFQTANGSIYSECRNP